MKRKVNQVGTGTLTVSLPNKWVEKNKIKKGDEIEVEETNKELIIKLENTKKSVKKATLNMDHFNKMMVNRYIHELYRQGIEEITLNFTKEKFSDYKNKNEVPVIEHVKKIIERFIGIEIISQTKNKIIISSLIKQDESEKIKAVEMRIYYLIKEFLDEFIKAMDSDFDRFHKIVYDYHDNISKFTYYYLRLLNRSKYSEEQKARLFGFFIVIDKVIDKLRHTSERVNEMKKITPKIKDSLNEIFALFLEQFDMITKENYTIKEVEQIIKKRYNLVNKIKSEKYTIEETKVISECSFLLDTLTDFSETYIAINLEKYLEK